MSARSIQNGAIAVQLAQGNGQVQDLNRRAARLVGWFHHFVFNGRLGRSAGGQRTPEQVVAAMGASAATWFRNIEAICMLLADSADPSKQRATVVPAGWDYTVNDDGTVTLIEGAVEPFELAAAG